MHDLLFPVDPKSGEALQTQLRRHLVEAILDGRLGPERPLPSCRSLAQALGISRNTVVLTYQALAGEGLLESRERVGYFVNAGVERSQRPEAASEEPGAEHPLNARSLVDRLATIPSALPVIEKPRDWRRQPYPFVYGQSDPELFPVAAWRHCSRQALSLDAIRDWSDDSIDQDDAHLVEQIRTRILPRRGIKAAPEEILLTVGAQHGLAVLAQLLGGPGRILAVEDPGYVDARSLFEMAGSPLMPIPVDAEGLVVDERLAAADLLFVTPSHQSPTTVTLSRARRAALLERAARHDLILIEDDYEAETNYVSAPTAALKSIDREGRVIYVGSLSKHLAPGLRLGFLVAPTPFIREARALRRLTLRHPPRNNQRTLALFMSGGYYDAQVSRLQRTFKTRWQLLRDALAAHLPAMATPPSFGGTAFWVEGPAGLDAEALAAALWRDGVVIEPGKSHYLRRPAPRNVFRLGFSAIPTERIEEGVRRIARHLGTVS